MPLTLHDLPARETYIQIAASLKALQDAVNGVFARIEGAVESRTGECLVICDVRVYAAMLTTIAFRSACLSMMSVNGSLLQSACMSF